MRLRRPFWRRRGTPLNCGEVARVLQAYIDGELEAGADLVADHLEDCRRCGLEEALYTDIKVSLATRGGEVDPDALERLRSFGRELAAGARREDPGPGSGPDRRGD